MSSMLFVSTREGMVAFTRQEEGWREFARGLIGRHVTCMAAGGDVVLAGATDGIFRADDGGKNWLNLAPGSYCRAAWVAQVDADHIILGSAKGVDVGGRIEHSVDGGKSWQLASRGLQVPWPSYMVDRFIPQGDELFAVLSNGRLLVAGLDELVWRPILAEVAGITMVAVA